MEQDQPISSRHIFYWSLAAIFGVLMLSFFGHHIPEHQQQSRCYFNSECHAPRHASLKVRPMNHGNFINLEVELSDNLSQKLSPSLACKRPSETASASDLLEVLVSPQKPVVISFGN
ncbi:MAG: hypothetical protein ACR2PX_02730 [Endozoicomonas sp.]|uniref:hypothetical protein n=1 Tax=Endozoicomonas sp. TaxID=1892382 RepID=UPI003D9AFC5E